MFKLKCIAACFSAITIIIFVYIICCYVFVLLNGPSHQASPVTFIINEVFNAKSAFGSNFEKPQKWKQCISKKLYRINKYNMNTMFSMLKKYNINKVPENDCKSSFITIHDGGRTGNQICQLMSLMLFRKDFGLRIAMSSKMNTHLSKLFQNIQVPVAKLPCYNSTSMLGVDILNFYFAKFNELVAKKRLTIDTNHSINCHPCQIMLLYRHRPEFRKELKIKEAIIDLAKITINNSLKEKGIEYLNTTLISIHVRRTDYIHFAKQFDLTIPQESFYRKAMSFYRERCQNVVFLVISDDVKWSQSHISAPDTIFPGTGNIENPGLDYAMMTLCHHHIIGLGTFSKTSAFLGHGTITQSASTRKTKLKSGQLEFDCKSSDHEIFL